MPPASAPPSALWAPLTALDSPRCVSILQIKKEMNDDVEKLVIEARVAVVAECSATAHYLVSWGWLLGYVAALQTRRDTHKAQMMSYGAATRPVPSRRLHGL